jgi:hypothetical protein
MKESQNEARLFLTVLLAVFVALKLAGTLAWPWLWVLAPLWGPVALAITAILLGALIAVIRASFDFVKDILK